MTILLDASMDCNGACKYCYNAPLRGSMPGDIPNVPAIKNTLNTLTEKNISSRICLHGGEPLLLPRGILDDLLGFINTLRYGDDRMKVSIQTNGLLLDENMIGVLKGHNVSVGVSIDGFGGLNRFRFGKQKTRLIERNLFAAKGAGMDMGVLSVIHRKNGLPKQRDRFKDFMLRINEGGMQGRLLPCVHPDPKIQLTPVEARDFYLDIADFVILHGMHGWSPYSDMIYSILGQSDKAMCFFQGCDPFSTKAGIVVTSQGKVSVCHKFMDEHIQYTTPMSIRKTILAATDCVGCNFFENCTGGCPANATDRDWRKKTMWCPVYRPLWKKMLNLLRFTNIETVLKEMKQ